MHLTRSALAPPYHVLRGRGHELKHWVQVAAVELALW